MRDILDETAWSEPRHFKQTVNREELKKVLMVSNGELLACGSLWEIKYSEIDSTGMYIIWLEKVEPKRW